jgi:integrase
LTREAWKNFSLIKGKTARPFLEAIGSRYTRAQYERRLITFLERVKMDVDQFVTKAQRNPKWAQEAITDYMLSQKERFQNKEIEASSIRSVMKPLKLLMDMNDVTTINWKKIAKMMPPTRNYALDRAPSVEELRTMLSSTELRFQAILLAMVSGGFRVGAWEYLKWGHVQPIKTDAKVVAAKLTVYAGEPEEYVTFITPEAYERLEQYIRFREQHGEKVTKDSPLARDRWRTNGARPWQFNGEIGKPVRLMPDGVKRLFEETMWKLGFRTEKKRRHEFSVHSLRKYFKTHAELAGMKPINVETLMGHSTGISDSYYRPTERNLLDDYLRAAPQLTVSEVEEVRHQSLEVEKANAERLKQLEALVSQLVAEKGQQVLVLDQNRRSDTSPR